MKINLTKIFLDSMPVDARLPFGVVKNVRLTGISNEPRTDRKGQLIKKNCFLTFGQYNGEGKIISESTFSYFNFEKPDYAKDNFSHQLIQLTEILTYCMPKDVASDVVDKIGDYVNDNIEDYDQIFNKPIKNADIPFVTDTMTALVDYIISISEEHISDGRLVQLMLGCDKTGKFVDLPREDTGFIADNKSKDLRVPAKYVNWRAKKDIPQTDSPDLVEEDAMVMDSTDVLADAADDLEGI